MTHRYSVTDRILEFQVKALPNFSKIIIINEKLTSLLSINYIVCIYNLSIIKMLISHLHPWSLLSLALYVTPNHKCLISIVVFSIFLSNNKNKNICNWTT